MQQDETRGLLGGVGGINQSFVLGSGTVTCNKVLIARISSAVCKGMNV